MLYFGLASVFIFPNEVCQPFVSGLGYAMNWFSKSIMGWILPFLYNGLPIYWTPFIMVCIGILVFIVIRPLILETQGKTFQGIEFEYSKFKYNLFSK